MGGKWPGPRDPATFLFATPPQLGPTPSGPFRSTRGGRAGRGPRPSRQPAPPARAPCTNSLAAATAAGTSSPWARRAAMAADREQPVPWVLGVSTWLPVEDGDCRPVEEHVGHLGRSRRAGRRVATPGRWPPLTRTQVGPSSWMPPGQPRPWRRRRGAAAGSTPARRAASHRLGVATRAWGSSARR